MSSATSLSSCSRDGGFVADLIEAIDSLAASIGPPGSASVIAMPATNGARTTRTHSSSEKSALVVMWFPFVGVPHPLQIAPAGATGRPRLPPLAARDENRPCADSPDCVLRLVASRRGRLVRRWGGRAVGLTITGIGLYIVAPSMVAMFASWPQLAVVDVPWFFVLAGLQLGRLVSLWWLTKLALAPARTRDDV